MAGIFGLLAFLIWNQGQPIIQEIYAENTVPPEWFKDYSEARIKQLMKEFEESGAITKWMDSQISFGKDKLNLLSATAYMDNEDGYDKPIWIIRLSLPNNWGAKETQEILQPLSVSLGKLIRNYKPSSPQNNDDLKSEK